MILFTRFSINLEFAKANFCSNFANSKELNELPPLYQSNLCR